MGQRTDGRFRILSLDGGGIKGVFTASVLAELEHMTGKRVVEYFDLLTGTSTGGIIALALAVGIPAGKILDFYTNYGPTIFPAIGIETRWWRGLRRIMRAKHDGTVLRNALATVFADKKLGHASCRVVIPAFDALGGRVHLFKTCHCERFRQDYQRSCVHMALATAAAPTYLPAFQADDGTAYVDGGVWANDPILVGVLEAIVNLHHAPEDLDVLSIGTTEEPFHISKRRRRRGGILQWALGVVPLLMHAQAEAARAQAGILLPSQPLRINRYVEPGRFSMDDSRQINDLDGLGRLEARRYEKAISERFLSTRTQPFRPCHTP
jgi:patatin-like phospholipase/acyl hydrolase